MKLKILLPARILVDQEVQKVIAEGADGSFCLLPRHIDFVSALVPGILSFEQSSGEETFVAIDEGILVKVGQEVLVSTRNAVRGGRLGELKRMVQERFETRDENEKAARSALARIEAGFVNRFLEIQGRR
ncbi:MAG: F0F1 ATP synthase subunit epsilon [Deltaproteobacteria bacterium HGW-Deltaproteobacteria-15]|jgi:F-type H+-transporting ATPase subunit epsilon|nr:MAG: F0F1 ATP synthase subunit epsilon [Deltaproteobacteria bacterium HGW-Deltaproteobacteria-15]